jgi:hypothetical protein
MNFNDSGFRSKVRGLRNGIEILGLSWKNSPDFIQMPAFIFKVRLDFIMVFGAFLLYLTSPPSRHCCVFDAEGYSFIPARGGQAMVYRPSARCMLTQFVIFYGLGE